MADDDIAKAHIFEVSCLFSVLWEFPETDVEPCSRKCEFAFRPTDSALQVKDEALHDALGRTHAFYSFQRRVIKQIKPVVSRDDVSTRSYFFNVEYSFKICNNFLDDVEQAEEGAEGDVDPTDAALREFAQELENALHDFPVQNLDVDADFDDLVDVMVETPMGISWTETDDFVGPTWVYGKRLRGEPIKLPPKKKVK